MVARASRWSPDVVVVDLEDAVSAPLKGAARLSAIAAVNAADPDLTLWVRINPAGTRWFAEDLAAVAAYSAHGVVLPEYETVEDAQMIRDQLDETVALVVGLETARGVEGCADLLGAVDVDAVYFGAEDYIADLGGSRTPGGAEVLYACSQVMLGALLAGAAAIDQAAVELTDDARFVADAKAGKSIGYTGKICVHPRQVDLAHRVFTPSTSDVTWARAVLGMAQHSGVGTVEGKMADDVHMRMARRVLARMRDETGER